MVLLWLDVELGLGEGERMNEILKDINILHNMCFGINDY